MFISFSFSWGHNSALWSADPISILRFCSLYVDGNIPVDMEIMYRRLIWKASKELSVAMSQEVYFGVLPQGYFHILYSIGKEEQLQLCLGIKSSFVEINKIISFSVGQSSIVFKHWVWVNSRLFLFRGEIINCFPPLNVPGLFEMTSPAHSSKLCIWLAWQKLSNDLNMVQFVGKKYLKKIHVF